MHYKNRVIFPRIYLTKNIFLEKMLTFVIIPQLRVALLRVFGAKIGNNVRLHEIRLFNLQNGFSHLVIEDDVHIGPGTRIDLFRTVIIKKNTVISPECLLLTHTDMGEYHNSPLSQLYPSIATELTIGNSCFLGSRAIILAGSNLGTGTLVATGSVVRTPFEGRVMIAGSPAKIIKCIELPS